MEAWEIKAFLSEDGKFLEKCNSAISAVMAENIKLKKVLVELDTGGTDYLNCRRDIAALSGGPMMGWNWAEHIAKIKDKLEAKELKK